MWEPQLEGLRHRARLVAPDLPGFGLSPAPTTIPSLDVYASQILATLDALGVDQVVLVGLSMGGYVAFRLVEHLGARLQGLFLADTKAKPDIEEAMLRRRELAAEVERSGVDVVANAMVPQILGGPTQQLRPGLLDFVIIRIRAKLEH
jgi:pimeloyl-ACP methyl ester carboxylesterase